MKKVSDFVIKYSKTIITFVVLITIIMGYFVSKIEIQAGIEDMFPDHNPIVQRFNRANDQFGGMTFAVLMMEDDNIIDSETLHKIANLTEELEKISGVEEVVSLTNVDQIKGNLFGIEISQLIKTIPETKIEEDELKEIIMNNDQYSGSLISKDCKATGITVTFGKDLADTLQPVQEIKKVAQSYIGPEKIYFTGNPVIVNDAQESLKGDIFKLLPFVLAIFILILWLSFRRVSGILLPLATVLISIIWTIGALALLNKPLSIISVALPILLVSVGSAYTIHIIARLQEELAAGATGIIAVKNAITHVGIAVLIAGITTIVGFGSLVFSDLVIIKEFALSTAFGIAIALAISIFFVPAVYAHISVKSREKKSAQGNRSLTRGFAWVFNLVSQKSYFVFGVVILMVLISLLGMPRLYPETGYLNYFKADSSTRIAAAIVDQRFGGSGTLDIIIQGDVKDPDLLSRMAEFQDAAVQIDGLNNPISIVTLLRTVNQALNGDDPSMKVIPTTRQQIAQYLLLLNMSGPDATKPYLTFDEQTSRIQFLMENMEGSKIQQALEQVDQLILNHFSDKYQVEVTGMPVLTNEISNLLIRSQIQSIIASILLTFVITSILLKSIKRGLFCCLTIILTVVVNFGVMSWLKVPLDIATTMIASIAVGIGVDYSIHISTRYREEENSKHDPYLAMQNTIQHVGRANLYNAFAVIAGFCVLLLSSFPPIVSFGGLTALTMVVSFSSAIFLLPSLILLKPKATQNYVKKL